jgi:hypothetical protein
LELQTGANVAAIGAPANGVISVGSGIRFPATQVASANANTLDDYEEGTFTATLVTPTSGTITLKTPGGLMAYTKMGRQVTVSGMLWVDSVSLPVGANVRLSGLPFTISNLALYASRGGGSATYLDASAGTRALVPVTLTESETLAVLRIDASTVEASDQINVTLTYFV